MTEQLDAKNPETYRRTAGVLIERGHTKGIAEDLNGRMCVGGALCFVLTGNAWNWKTANSTAAILELLSTVEYGEEDRLHACRISQWNNTPERTSGEVIEALLETAKRLETAQAGVR